MKLKLHVELSNKARCFFGTETLTYRIYMFTVGNGQSPQPRTFVNSYEPVPAEIGETGASWSAGQVGPSAISLN